MIEALKMRPGEISSTRRDYLERVYLRRAEGKFMAKKVTVYSQQG
jgi:hypothetical protein